MPHLHRRRLLLTLAATALAGPVLARDVTPRGPLDTEETDTIALFEAAKPSVVFISTSGRIEDPWTRHAFEAPRGSGSGFVWDERGHVVTNAHVIEGASAATVRLADGTAADARLVGVAPSADLAVLHIPPSGLRPLPLGTSADLRVGQKVLAIGNPFGLDWTLTTGIVSALERELPGNGGLRLRGLIQTDAAINPGNSGGPLLDSAGRLIGVNTAIYSPSGGSAGIGFAVPVDLVARIVPQLIETGRFAPPVLGIESDPRLDAFAAREGIAGAVVLGVIPGSGADRAGLRAARTAPDGGIALGDVITGLDGEPVADTQRLRLLLAERSPGDTVTLRLLRDGAEVTVRATLAPG